MTLCEKLGYKVGDRFEVVESNGYFCEGEIVSLTYDDGSSYPKFSNGEKEHYKSLSNVRPIMRTQQLTPQNPIEYLKTAHANGDTINPETMLHECFGITKTERVVTEWSEVKRAIKVGDLVRIVGNKYPTDNRGVFGEPSGHSFDIGEIVTIEEVDNNDKELPYYAYGEHGWMTADDVELV